MKIPNNIIFLCSIIFFISSARSQEISIYNNVYINDIYKFSIIIPQKYKICSISPFTEHNIALIPLHSRCNSEIYMDTVSISVDQAFSIAASPDVVAEMACKDGKYSNSGLKISDVPLFVCSEQKEKNILRTFFIRNVSSDKSDENYIFYVSFTGDVPSRLPTLENKDNNSAWSVLRGFRFLDE